MAIVDITAAAVAGYFRARAKILILFVLTYAALC